MIPTADEEEKKAFADKIMAAIKHSSWTPYYVPVEDSDWVFTSKYTKAFSLFTVAQAAVESSWGKGTLSKYNNYFGIKFFGDFAKRGTYVSLGAAEGGKSNFRVFPSIEDCLDFRYKFLTNPIGRYHKCWGIMLKDNDESTEKMLSAVRRYGTCIQLAGYCSNDNYGGLLYSLAKNMIGDGVIKV